MVTLACTRTERLLAIACLLVGGVCSYCAPTAQGHAVFKSYIRHDVSVRVDPTNIDITVELTFYELPSLTERQRMDRDRNRAITTNEIQNYLTSKSASFEGAVVLHIDGQAVDVLTLYEPQVDLLGVDDIALSHHVVRLFYFARTPAWLNAGKEIVVQDNLWEATPAIRSLQVSGEGGFTLTGEQNVDMYSEPGGEAESRELRARCLVSPPSPARNEAKHEIAAAGTTHKKNWLTTSTLIGIILTIITVGLTGGVKLYAQRRRG